MANTKHGLNDLIEALTIFAKYGKGGYAPTNCSHDVFAVCDGIAEDAVSDEDKARLDELGFEWSDEYDSWYSFRFGSC